MAVACLPSCGLFLLSARFLEYQESQDSTYYPPGRLQTLHSTLQSLPDGQGWTGVGSSATRGHPPRGSGVRCHPVVSGSVPSS